MARRPGWTGMRKMLSDGQRALDVLAAHPAVDRRRLGVIGHSLGAKEALYTAAFDTRVKAAVFSEGGIGMASTNWEAPWYLGEQAKGPRFTADHHELLAMCAPRAFLLLGGDSADGANSEPYIEAARPVYALYGKPEAVEMLNHHGGHALPPKADAAAYAWLERWLR
jgi:dienelactone hydrolase